MASKSPPAVPSLQFPPRSPGALSPLLPLATNRITLDFSKSQNLEIKVRVSVSFETKGGYDGMLVDRIATATLGRHRRVRPPSYSPSASRPPSAPTATTVELLRVRRAERALLQQGAEAGRADGGQDLCGRRARRAHCVQNGHVGRGEGRGGAAGRWEHQARAALGAWGCA